MAYTEELKKEKFDFIINEIELGSSLRKALQIYGMPSSCTFYEWIEEDESKAKQYARACNLRADNLFEEILEIADKQDKDVVGEDENGNEIVNHNIVQRNRLQIDARKWMLAKLNPKKYGDRQEIDHTSKGNPIFVNLGSGQNPDEATT